ncbi:MAG: hypothetical protein Fur002_20390 [Anaerolineales bacterium]
MSLTGSLLQRFESAIASIALIPADGGRFEVVVNGSLIFSKLETHRHPEPGEIAERIAQLLDTNKNSEI